MVLDAKAILTRVREQHGVTLRDSHGEGSPVLTEGAIGFNGDASAGLDFESFWVAYAIDPMKDRWLAKGYADRGFVWDFCKTGRRPYDLAVCAVLLRCHLLAPDAFAIGSDGRWDIDWRPARALYAELFGGDGDTDPLTSTADGPLAAQASDRRRR